MSKLKEGFSQLYGFVKNDTWISLSCYLDLSKLIHGFAKVFLCISRPLANKTKLKFDQDFIAYWSFCLELKVLNKSKYSNPWVRCPSAFDVFVGIESTCYGTSKNIRTSTYSILSARSYIIEACTSFTLSKRYIPQDDNHDDCNYDNYPVATLYFNNKYVFTPVMGKSFYFRAYHSTIWTISLSQYPSQNTNLIMNEIKSIKIDFPRKWINSFTREVLKTSQELRMLTLSRFKFRNLSGIVNCVAKSLIQFLGLSVAVSVIVVL